MDACAFRSLETGLLRASTGPPESSKVSGVFRTDTAVKGVKGFLPFLAFCHHQCSCSLAMQDGGLLAGTSWAASLPSATPHDRGHCTGKKKKKKAQQSAPCVCVGPDVTHLLP